jgi:DNA-binding transcriptional regulator YdaS (Cro superfamily)
LTGEVFRQQLIKLWPINIIWPHIIQLIRCQKGNSATRTTDVNNPTKRQFENNQTIQIDQSLISTKTNHNDDQSL